MNNKEVRLLAKNLEAREDDSDGKMIVEGYAIMFNSPATHGYTENVLPSALDECDMKDVPLRYNHSDQFLILARTRNNSLELVKDDVGLKIRADLLDTSTGKDIYKAIKAKLLDKMSFAFTIPDDGEEWSLLDTDTPLRTITKIDRLYDVSVVDTPFYDSTSIYARALSSLDSEKKKLDNLKEQRELARRKLMLKSKILKEKGVQ